ncbi:HAD family hydrolase [Streptomyces sp. LaPpAH-108]|uniref:HAD family hydrolase n=1 Tax=Streptomyces sp. LaPpAH-108 TaxID=1155714 RepID=UPI00037163EE|nr:HAD family hydrolase [Streptomyces sp. LaPpAH-108]
MMRAVIFDVGECLVDETAEWGAWADWLGVPRHTFSAVFGAVVARGGDWREVFDAFRPGFDLSAAREEREEAGLPQTVTEADLYPDVRDTLATLRADGLWLGIAANQNARAGRCLRELFASDVDLIGLSEDWGTAKPDPAFFARLVSLVPAEPHEMLYVGDRLDNDIRPAHDAGLHTALLHRGPWAALHPREKKSDRLPTFHIESLLELSPLIAHFNENHR